VDVYPPPRLARELFDDHDEDLLGLPMYRIGLALTVLAAVLTLWSMSIYLKAAWPELKSKGHPDRARP
jgi:phosphatidylglycerophosphate synthase